MKTFAWTLFLVLLFVDVKLISQDKEQPKEQTTEQKAEQKESKEEKIQEPGEVDQLKLEIAGEKYKLADTRFNDAYLLWLNTPGATKLKVDSDDKLKELNTLVGEIMDKLKIDRKNYHWDVDTKKFVHNEAKK